MDQLNLSEVEWRRRLTAEQYHVLREAGSGTAGVVADRGRDGVYRCAGCQLPLFDTADRLAGDLGGFAEPIAPDRLSEHGDPRHARAEIRCARCDGHLGHAYPADDGAGGKRYAADAAALDFRSRR